VSQGKYCFSSFHPTLYRKIRLTVDPNAVKLIKSNPFLSRADLNYANPAIESFLRRDDAVPRVSQLDFPPLFPRVPLPSSSQKKSGNGLQSLPEVGKILSKVKTEDNEVEIYNQNMAVVDGWRKFRLKELVLR
jgi:hypothetical protein